MIAEKDRTQKEKEVTSTVSVNNSNDTLLTITDTEPTSTTIPSCWDGWIDYENLIDVSTKIEMMLHDLQMERSKWALPKQHYPIKFYNKYIKTHIKQIRLRPMKTSLRPRWFPRKMVNKNRT